MKVEFDNSLVTGNEMIDGQHKELIAKIDKLVTCCQEGGEKMQAIKMLDYLAEYTDFHFSAEEKLQEEVSYPAIEGHKAKHEEFKKAVDELHEMLVEEEGPTDAFVAAVEKNVVNWLFDHIKNMDQALAAYIQENK
ncbi:MAG: hemerythrin family protein [Clostridiales bacterium]|nr:hemerythrin family protein [Lachnospiraceae bacterium]MDD6618392.1 hemerythrin family protein [Clostridiales bacterium]MDY4769870.1 hemerythrin family protein [Lachnospiraceae bacterium]